MWDSPEALTHFSNIVRNFHTHWYQQELLVLSALEEHTLKAETEDVSHENTYMSQVKPLHGTQTLSALYFPVSGEYFPPQLHAARIKEPELSLEVQFQKK